MERLTDKLKISPAFQRAYLGGLPNLVKSGNLEKYYQLLTDFYFLTAKINHPEFGVQGLIEDYDLVDDFLQTDLVSGEKFSLSPEKVKTLKQLQGTLQLSSHILNRDRTELAGQSRLQPLLSSPLPTRKGLFPPHPSPLSTRKIRFINRNSQPTAEFRQLSQPKSSRCAPNPLPNSANSNRVLLQPKPPHNLVRPLTDIKTNEKQLLYPLQYSVKLLFLPELKRLQL